MRVYYYFHHPFSGACCCCLKNSRPEWVQSPFVIRHRLYTNVFRFSKNVSIPILRNTSGTWNISLYIISFYISKTILFFFTLTNKQSWLVDCLIWRLGLCHSVWAINPWRQCYKIDAIKRKLAFFFSWKEKETSQIKKKNKEIKGESRTTKGKKRKIRNKKWPSRVHFQHHSGRVKAKRDEAVPEIIIQLQKGRFSLCDGRSWNRDDQVRHRGSVVD